MIKTDKKLSFPKNYFLHSREYPLTASMITGLKSACVKQSAGISFGPIDIKKSTALIRRGFLISTQSIKNKQILISWKVSDLAIESLTAIGAIDPGTCLPPINKRHSHKLLQ